MFTKPRRGQSLVEFAIVLPVLLALIGGVVQVGAIFAARHALVQVARDTGRWAATQTRDPCAKAATDAPPQPLTQANLFASEAGILGYSSGWNVFMAYPDNTQLPASAPNADGGVEVVWSREGGGACVRPLDNRVTEYVTVRLAHGVPVFIPGLEYLPLSITCQSSGCTFPVTATSQFRMEPQEDQ